MNEEKSVTVNYISYASDKAFAKLTKDPGNKALLKEYICKIRQEPKSSRWEKIIKQPKTAC